MANYPNTMPTLRAVENDPGVAYDPLQKNVVFAEDINNMAAEIKAIAAELGTTPKGSDPDVAARLNDISDKVATYRENINSLATRVTALENKGYTRRIAMVDRGSGQVATGSIPNNGVHIIRNSSNTGEFVCNIPSTTKKLLLTIRLMVWVNQGGWWNISYVRMTNTGQIQSAWKQALIHHEGATEIFSHQYEIEGDANTTGFKIIIQNGSGSNRELYYRNGQMTVDEIG